jgi:hypothetical protein
LDHLLPLLREVPPQLLQPLLDRLLQGELSFY